MLKEVYDAEQTNSRRSFSVTNKLEDVQIDSTDDPNLESDIVGNSLSQNAVLEACLAGKCVCE
jgi:hypothetical protein